MFYNLFNEEVSQETILNDLINYYKELHDENKTSITDFNEGSEIRTLLEVLSHLAYNILEEQNETLSNHFINTAEGEYLDLIGANPNVNLPREEGSNASGLVKFSLTEPSTEEKIIPANTMINSGEQEYTTVEEGFINIGESYTYIMVECVIDGEEGNCKTGEINNCEDYPEFIVTNEEPFTNGADFEDDEAYRQKLLEYVRTDNFGSRGYYENILLSLENVHDIKINTNIENEYTVAYYLNTNNYENNFTAVNLAIEYFNDNNNILIGHSFDFRISHIYYLSFTVHLPVNCEVNETEIKECIRSIFTGEEMSTVPSGEYGLNMGETISKNELISKITGFYNEITSMTVDNILVDGESSEDINFTDANPYNAFELQEITVEYDLT